MGPRLASGWRRHVAQRRGAAIPLAETTPLAWVWRSGRSAAGAVEARSFDDLGDPDARADDAQDRHPKAAEEFEDDGHREHSQDQDGPVRDNVDVPYDRFLGDSGPTSCTGDGHWSSVICVTSLRQHSAGDSGALRRAAVAVGLPGAPPDSASGLRAVASASHVRRPTILGSCWAMTAIDMAPRRG